MKSEKAKMLAGELYHAMDPELVQLRQRARDLCRTLAATPVTPPELRHHVLRELLGAANDAWVEPPFHCDYGTQIQLGEQVFVNFNCVILDVVSVRIGAYSMLGPAVQILTPLHPMDATERRVGLEYARPVEIGSDVWIGGGAIICPGVTVGDRTVIGAGSVVTRSLPSDVFAAGNPCRVIRSLSAKTKNALA